MPLRDAGTDPKITDCAVVLSGLGPDAIVAFDGVHPDKLPCIEVESGARVVGFDLEKFLRPGRRMRIGEKALRDLPIPVPDYDRENVTAGIAHIGVGGFHRAHQAWYVDRLLSGGEAARWGIHGIGVLPADRRMKEALTAQGGLYTLILAHPDGSWEPRVIGSIVDFRYAPDDPGAVIELLANPAIRIISLTITEGGYNLRHEDGEFDVDNPGVQQDLKGDHLPATVFGLVVTALARRRDRGAASPTIVSCDNIESNGEVACRAFTTYAQLSDPELAQWIRDNTSFPNSMVDRITPVTTAAVIEQLENKYGVQDAWPVLAEPFAAWVLEDRFPTGRPPLERVGVQLVDDVSPYEAMKLRLLNAGHQSLGYFAFLCGYRFVHEAAQDPVIAEFLQQYWDVEAMPTLRPVPGLGEFKDALLQRFSNANVCDTVARLCAESSDRIPKWLLPVVRDNLRAGGSVRLAAATVASWARYAEGVDEDGEPIDVVDRLADSLVPIARSQREKPAVFLQNRAVFGDLADHPRFSEAYLWALESLHRDGAHATLEALLKQGDRR